MIVEWLEAGFFALMLAAAAVVVTAIVVAAPIEKSPIETPDKKTSRHRMNDLFTGWGILVTVSIAVWLMALVLGGVTALGFVLTEVLGLL